MIMRPMRIVRRSQAATIKTEYRFAIDLHARYMSTGRVLQVREPAPRTLADFFSGIGLLHHLQRIINDFVLTGALLQLMQDWSSHCSMATIRSKSKEFVQIGHGLSLIFMLYS